MATNGRINRISHIVNGKKIVQLEDIYSNIGDTCGIVALTLPAPADSESESLRKMVKNGLLRRARVRVTSTSTTGSPIRTRTVYMSASQAPKVGALVGLDLSPGETIKSAYFPQRITLG